MVRIYENAGAGKRLPGHRRALPAPSRGGRKSAARVRFFKTLKRAGAGKACLHGLKQRRADAAPLSVRGDKQVMQKIVVFGDGRKPEPVAVRLRHQNRFAKRVGVKILQLPFAAVKPRPAFAPGM
ncbi:hypothetical protein CRSA0334_00925 [Cronobacter malonaticus ENBT0334]|nr:hypothetical protein CRSA0334_00925 [Cronobacter malonaticus ENBT0334]